MVGDVNDLEKLLLKFDVTLTAEEKEAGGLFIPFDIKEGDRPMAAQIVWIPKFDDTPASISNLVHEISHCVTEMIVESGSLDESHCCSELVAYMTGALTTQAMAYLRGEIEESLRSTLPKLMTISYEMAKTLEI